MNQNTMILDKINGFIISILLVGTSISGQLVYVRDMQSINDKIIIIIAILSLSFIFYWKYLRSKNIFYDILIIFCLICLCYLYIKYYIDNFPIFLFVLLFLSLFIFCKQGIRNKNYLFLVLIFFIMIVMLNIIILGITNGEYSEIKYKYFFIYSLIPCFYILAVANENNLKWSKKSIWFICLFILIFGLENYFKYNIKYNKEVMKLSMDQISTACVFGMIFIYIFFEKLVFQRKKIYLFLLPLSFFFMLLSGSRGPFISLLVTMTIYFLINFNKRFLAFTIITLLIILLCVIFFINSDFHVNSLENRFEGFYRINSTIKGYFRGEMGIEDLFSARMYYYSKSMKEFYNYPLFGVGVGTDENFGTYAHNSFLEIASQLGIIALIFYLLIIGIWFFQFYRSEKKGFFEFRFFKYLFIYFLVESLFSGSIFFNYPFWSTLTVSGVIFSIESKKLLNSKINEERLNG